MLTPLGVTFLYPCCVPLLQPIPLLVSLDGASVHGLDGLMVPYPRIPQQQLLPLDQNGYSTDLYRQGLTPPQLPGDHLHPYGRRAPGSLHRSHVPAPKLPKPRIQPCQWSTGLGRSSEEVWRGQSLRLSSAGVWGVSLGSSLQGETFGWGREELCPVLVPAWGPLVLTVVYLCDAATHQLPSWNVPVPRPHLSPSLSSSRLRRSFPRHGQRQHQPPGRLPALHG